MKEGRKEGKTEGQEMKVNEGRKKGNSCVLATDY
jgi:hypothetical protein